MASFWNLPTVEPKRNFRYKITFPGNTINLAEATLFAQKVSKPSFKVSSVQYQYLNHKFNYPGRVEWDDISIDFVDVGGSTGMPDMAQKLTRIINKAGYYVPQNASDVKSISKKSLTNLIGGDAAFFSIEQLNAAGKTVEHWKVYNPLFLDMKFGDLSYDSDEMSKITVTVKYDYATLENIVTTDPGVFWLPPNSVPDNEY